MGKEVDLIVNLVNEGGISTGSITITAVLKKTVKETQEATASLPPGFTEGILHVARIEAFDLKYGTHLTQQRPFMQLRLNEWTDKTFTSETSETDCVFNYLDLRTKITAADISAGKLVVEFWDENMFNHKLVGSGNVRLNAVSKFGDEVELKVTFKDNKFAIVGRASVFVVLEKPAMKEVEVVLPPGLTSANVFIKRICAYGLRDVEWMPGSRQVSSPAQDLHR